jgi:chromosome segregation ATPase
MTKDELEHIKRGIRYGSYNVMSGETALNIINALEQAWAEREEAHLTITRLANQRDRLVQLNNDLVEGMSVHRTIISNLQQQNTELLEDVEALRKETNIMQKNLDDTFGNMLEAQEERDALKAKKVLMASTSSLPQASPPSSPLGREGA